MKTPIQELIKEKQEKYETWFDEFGYAFTYIRMSDFKKAIEEIFEEQFKQAIIEAYVFAEIKLKTKAFALTGVKYQTDENQIKAIRNRAEQYYKDKYETKK